MSKTLGMIGCGNMANAIIGGVVKAGLFKGDNIIASDAYEPSLNKCKEAYGIRTSLNDNITVAKESDIIILAVKPNVYKDVVLEIKDVVKKDAIIVTIAAGMSIRFIEENFGREVKVVRTMPNTAALVGESMTALCKNNQVTEQEFEEIMNIFKGFGKAESLDEKLMEAVICVNGSSPAYIYMFLEAMGDGAVLAGIPRDKAYKMAAQAMMGAAKMMIETGKHPGELKDMVCSPAGTTIEAVYALEKAGFRAAVMEAMVKCTEKAEKMTGKK